MSAIRTARKIIKSILSREQMDGDGARVYRSIGTHQLRNLDPFLMLDEFDVKAPAGFPDHPHRGFETVTYMLEGEFLHEDFKGHKGRIGPGDLQWMSAARGIVHSEIPATNSRAHGLQLWVNLSSKDKMAEPNYQEYPASKVTRVSPEEGIDIKVIAGESYGAKSPVMTRTPTMYIDVKLAKGKTMEQVIPKEYVGFIYTISGTAMFGADKQKAEAHHTLVMDENGGTFIPVESLSDDCHFVIIAGKPIREPIVQYGPFVMNTQQEIYKAFHDYDRGTNGFEGAPGWTSSIRDRWA
ncbi:RmlC-like cupin domain-containing protein [Phascolomyces articulosus]|uniref:RmlC-like cupin domain-containing protein n=1 Tax=Phascolomyces articulosus TaxID=60185 RepID=A0AAD5KPP8_9FUNG|nr:RmlC-like cupin domain-containing protein [Phascolomyces articulosus]